MRETLEKCNAKKFYIFTGTISNTCYDRLAIKDVEVYDTSGKHLGTTDHILCAIRPFRNKNCGDKVRFTGKVYKYLRQDLTEDYAVTINKVS